MRHLLASLALAVGLTASQAAFASGNVEFDGRFSEIRTTGADCEAVFAETQYHARHALAGPSMRTSVLRFTQDGGFLDGLVLIGRLGGSNDLFYDKDLATDALTYKVHAEGFIDYTVLYLEFEVTGVDAEGQRVCNASATYSAFN